MDQRDLILLTEGADFRLALSEDDTAAGTDQGFLGLLDCRNHAGQLQAVALDTRLIAAHIESLRIGEILFEQLLLDIDRDIDEHRSLAAGVRNVKGLFEDMGNFVRAADQVGIFDKRLGCAAHIRLLENIASEEGGIDLPRDGNERNGVRIGGCECRD